MTDYLRLAQQRAPQAMEEQDNPYMPLAKQAQEQGQARARTVIEMALKDDPEIAAERLRLSQSSGLPPDVVQRNLEELRVKERARAVDLVTLAQESPILYRQIVDPNFATTSIDDLDTLKNIERAVGKGVRYVMGADGKGGLASDAAGFAKDVALGATVGTVKMSNNVAATLLDFFPGGDNAAAYYRNSAKQLQGVMGRYGSKPTTSTGQAVQSGAQSAGQNLAMLPLGLYRAMYATANQAASTVAALMATGVGAEAFSQAREQGRNEAQALTYAIPQGTFEYVFEKIPAAKLFGDIAANTGLLKTIGKQTLSEGWTEQLTTLTQDFNEWMNLNPEKTLAEFINERPEAAYQTFVATLVGVGVQTTTLRGINKVIEQASNESLVFEQDLLAEQMALASQSLLRQRSPEQFRAHVQQVVEGNDGAKKEIYIDGEVLNQLPQELLAQLPESVREAIPEAVELRSTVAIPMADVLTIAPGTELEQILNDNARMRPNAASRLEAQMAAELIQQEAQRVLEQAADQTVWQQSSMAVKQTILDQLTSTGRFTPDVNEAYATLQMHFFSTMAARTGKTPEQMYRDWSLAIASRSAGGNVLNAGTATPEFQTAISGDDVIKQINKIDTNGGNQNELINDYIKANRFALKTISPSELPSLDDLADTIDPYNRVLDPDLEKVRNYEVLLKAGNAPPPIVVDANGIILDGFHRALAAKDAGLPIPAYAPLDNSGALDPNILTGTTNANATRPGALTVEGFHYSKEARPIVSTAMFGTGLQGSNRDQYLNAADKRLRKRAYFYVDKGTGINPESGVGGIAQKAQLTNVYDADADPLRLKKGGQLAFESAVLDAGFSGYLTRMEGTQSGQVIMLGDQLINTQAIGPATQLQGQVVPAPQARESLGRDVIVDALNAAQGLPSGSPTRARWSEILQAQLPEAHAALQAAGVFEGRATDTLYKSDLIKEFENKTEAPVYGQGVFNQSFNDQATQLAADIEAVGNTVVDTMQIDQLIASNDIATITLQDLVGLSIFPTIADRTAAAALYTGIDSSRLDVAIPLLGGPFFPLRESNVQAGVVWANRGDGVIAQKAAKLKEGANYMLVLMGDANMHQSNSTVAAAFMGTLEAWARDGRISAANVDALNKLVRDIGAKAVDEARGRLAVAEQAVAAATDKAALDKAKKARSQAQKAVTTNSYLENFPGFDDVSISHAYMDGISFDARKRILEIMASKQALEIGAPPMQKILDATREPSLSGHRWGDGVLLVEVDQTNPQVELGTEGTTAHPDFPVGVRGRVVGKLNAPINWELLWQDWLAQNNEKEGPRRAFELAKPIVTVTQDLVDRIGPIEQANIDGARQARLAADFAAGNWRTSDNAVNKGGVSPQEFIDALMASDAKDTLTQYTLAEVKKGIKDGTKKIYQLGDGQIFFMLETRPDGTKYLASVVNNEKGARGIGAPAVVLKALEEGATDLDCFAVKSNKYPEGFLPSLYAAFGFEVTESYAFDPQYFQPQLPEDQRRLALADAVNYWKTSTPGFDPQVGMPDAVTMKWKGTDADRNEITQRYLRSGIEGLLAGGTRADVQAAAAEFDAPDSAAPGQAAAADGGRAAGDQGVGLGSSVASRARGTVQALADLTDSELANLALTPDDRAAVRRALGRPDDVSQGGVYNQAAGLTPGASRIGLSFKDVIKRTPELQAAAEKVKAGEMTAAEYDALVEQYKPVEPYTEVPAPASTEDMQGALTSDKVERIGLPSSNLEAGYPVGLRLDIPAYANHGVWVVSVHEQEAGYNAGKSIGYESVAAATDVSFGVVGKAALNIASGKPKSTIAVMKGAWKPTTPAGAKAAADAALNDPAWRQVGMDPERHSYFYDRATMEPIVSADEVIQIGPLVLAKNPQYGAKDEFLFQGPRGTFNPQQLLITLNENADLSTFLHESGHFFLEVMADLASQPNAPQQIKDDMAKVLAWFGVPDLATWNGYTLDEKRPYHEKWAESFEQYLFEGQAPSIELQPLFRRFRSWLVNVYKSLTHFMRGRDLQVNDEIRQVFGRMVATDEQIAQAEEAAGMLPDFEATNEAIEKLQARSLRDLKWTIKARDKYIKQLTKEAKELRKGVEAEVRKEVEAQPLYRAINWLKKGETVDPETGDQVKAEKGFRLSTEGLAEIYPETMLSRPDLTKLRGMTAKEGLHPDMVAEMFGFKNGDHLVRSILDAEPISSVVEGKTDQRMLERHGDLATPEAIEQAANEAVHNEARARSLATELKSQAEMLNPRQDTGRTATNGRAITVNAITQAAKEFAANIAARRRIKDLKNAAWQHRSAEARAGKRWQEATAKGDTQAAVQAKRDQLLNNLTVKALQEAQAEARKILEFFKRVTKDSNEKTVEKGRDPDVVNAMRAILAAYDVAPRLEKSALEYMELVGKNDPQMYSVLKPVVDGLVMQATPLTEMTMEQLRGLNDELRAMWVLAKRSRQMEVDGNLLDIEEAADELMARMDTIGIPDKVPGEQGAITDAEERGIKLRFARAILTRVEQWAERLDGGYGGPFLRLVFQPVKDAADRYRTAKVEYRTKFTELLKGIAPMLPPGSIDAPELGYTFGNARDSGTAELLHAILHTGNDSNKRKLLLGRGWATENADGTLDTARWDQFMQRMHDEGRITKAHYDFAQGVWDLLEQTKPLAQETHRKVFGRYFAEITANPVDTPFGQYRGGYVPAQTDSRLVKDAKLRELAEGENESMAYAFPASPSGFTKSRVEYNKPLLLDIRALAQHMDKVLLFSHMQGAVSDVRRLLTNKRVSYALDRIDPGAYEGMLIPWLNRAAKQIVETPVVGDRKLSRFLSAARSRAGMALMFANLSNTVQQITGFSLAAVKVKPGLLLSATAQFVADPKTTKQTVADASAYMKDRMLNEVGAMNDAVEEILVNPTLLERGQAWTNRHAYFLQAAVDNTMSPIVWTAAYNQAIQEGQGEKDAVRYADGVVRQTQGTTLPEDVSRFESGPGYARLFTQFVSYFNMMANTNATAMKQVVDEMGLRKGAGKLIYIALTGLLVNIWVAEAIALAFRGGPEDDDGDGYLDDWLAAVFGLGTVRGLVAQVPIVGQAAQLVINRFNDNPADDKFSLSPAVSLIESAVSSPASVYKAIADDGNAQKAVRDVAAAATLITGLPFYAAARPVGYLLGVAQGKIDPTGPVDLARGVVTGTASPESKQR